MDSPTLVSNESIESYNTVSTRFKEIQNIAMSYGAESFLEISKKLKIPKNCYIFGNHPSGVERVLDKKLNGVSFLINCSNIFYNLDVSDFSQTLEQSVRKELSKEFYTIRGGHVSVSFAKSVDNRTRYEVTAIGKQLSVDLVAQSKNNKINHQDVLKESINLLESIIE